MFGKILRSRFLGFIIPVGVSAYIIELFLRDQITLYIHPRYKIFSLAMALIALVLVVALFLTSQAWRSLLKPENSKRRIPIIELFVVILFVTVYVMPPSTLSPRAIDRKSVNLPSSSKASKEDSSSDCPENDPTSLEMWVFYLSTYDSVCYLGKQIKIEGFAVEAQDLPAPKGFFYLGKLMVSCCVIDARPYALPIERPKDFTELNNSWYSINGNFEFADLPTGRTVVVKVAEIKEVPAPENPYDFYSQ